MMGGDIRLDSEPERGSEFTFSIVAKPATVAAAADESRTSRAKCCGRVLVVDDNAVNLKGRGAHAPAARLRRGQRRRGR